LSPGDRAVVANMAPNTAPRTYFHRRAKLDYRRQTDRSEAQLRLIGIHAPCRLRSTPPHTPPRVIEIDLGAIGMHVAGPVVPRNCSHWRPANAGETRWRACARRPGASPAPAIAAITSCTNTSDPRLPIAAGLLARKARAWGCEPRRG
jgi:aconitate hydratase